MITQGSKRKLFVIIILFSLFSIISCLDSSIVEQIENQAATLQAVENTVQEYLLPVQNLTVAPNNDAGEVILTWEHPLGDQINYELFYYSSPITEENWNAVGSFEISQRNISTELIDQTYRISSCWSVPINQKYWFVVRQSIRGLSEIGLALEVLGPIIGIEIPDDTLSIPPSVIAPSNMVAIIDSGFRPDPNGYNFENAAPRNFSPSVTQKDYIDMLRWVFGDDDVCLYDVFGVCLPRSTVRKLAREERKSGQCSGFTTSSGLFFLGRADESDYSQGLRFVSLDTIEINSNEKILDFIMAYQLLLTRWEISEEWEASLNSSLDENLQSLEDLMLDPESVPNLSLISSNENWGAHSVLPYLFVSEEGKWTDVWVYDSNTSEDISRVVNLDLESDTWEYSFSDNQLWTSSIPSNSDTPYGSIQVHNISYYGGVENGDYIGKSPWLNNRKIVFTDSLCDILVTSSDNSRIGFTQSGEYVDEMPDGYFNIIDDLSTYIFVLPSGDYEYSIYSISDQSASFMSLGDGGSLFVESVSEGDHISEEEDSVAYHNDDSVTSPEISVILETATQSSRVTIASDIIVGNTITIHSDSGANEFLISSTMPTDYELEIEVINSEGEYNFENENITLSPDEMDIIQLEDNLSEDSPFIIGIDDDNDGDVDEENEVENHYDPDPEEDEDENGIGNDSSGRTILIISGIVVVVIGIIMVIIRKRRSNSRVRRNQYNRRMPYDPRKRNIRSSKDRYYRRGSRRNSRSLDRKKSDRGRNRPKRYK